MNIKAKPVAWRWKERVSDDFVTEWALTKYEPATTPRTVAIDPLYTADAIKQEVIAERERCAKVCEAEHVGNSVDDACDNDQERYYNTALRCAAEAIRKEPT